LNGLDAVQSLIAVSHWVDNIESNIAGSKRVAFKGTKTSFQQIRTVNQEISQRIVIPPAQLPIVYNWIDFSQGEITRTTEETDLAILGEGLFLVSDTQDPIGRKVYLTRDGNFHWDAEGRLRTSQGLFVLDSRAVSQWESSNEAIPILMDTATNTTYAHRDTLHLRTTDPATPLPLAARVDLEIDLARYLADGKIQGDLDDLRVTYWDGGKHVELAIAIDTSAGLDKTIISFRNPEVLKPGQLQDRLFLNYGNTVVGPGPSTTFGPFANFTDLFNDAVNSVVPPARPNWNLPTGDPTGTWSVNLAGGAGADADRELRQMTNTGADTNMVVNDGSSLTWNDYRFNVTYGNNSTDDDPIYIYFRYQNDNNYYRLVQHTGGVGGFTRRIERKVGGVTTVLAGDNYLPAGGSTSPSGFWREQLSIEVQGNAIRISNANGQTFAITDSSMPAALLSGTVGVGAFSEQAWWDDITVRPLVQPTVVRATEDGAIAMTGMGKPHAVTDIGWDTFIKDTIAIARPSNQQGLMYSWYGATTFENNPNSNGRLWIGTTRDDHFGQIQTASLEDTNTSVTELIPVLAMSQKVFAAIAKIITIYNSALDDMNQTIR
jgi:flagellar hook-basal body protein